MICLKCVLDIFVALIILVQLKQTGNMSGLVLVNCPVASIETSCVFRIMWQALLVCVTTLTVHCDVQTGSAICRHHSTFRQAG